MAVENYGGGCDDGWRKSLLDGRVTGPDRGGGWQHGGVEKS